MTVRLHKIKNAAHAHAYFTEKDDYYLSDKTAAQWYGEGAERLKLRGEVDPVAFDRVLKGGFGDEQVGSAGPRTVKLKDGSTKEIPGHAPGWDITFSAQKSVSVAALVNRDDRIIRAHDAAVMSALEVGAKYGVVTRQRGAGGGYEYRQADGMTVALVRHSSSRQLDCQLHTHALLMNGCIDPATGKWVSLDSRAMYSIAKEMNNEYEARMAAAGRECGYDVEWKINHSGFASATFADIPQEVCDAVSTRSREIKAWLEGKGIDPEKATPEQREEAALKTRQTKQHMPAEALHARWREQVKNVGYTPGSVPEAPKPFTEKDRIAAAKKAVATAAASITERKSRFTERELAAAATEFAQGRVTRVEIATEIARARERGDLIEVPTSVRHYAGEVETLPGMTTRQAAVIEARMLGHSAHLAASRAKLRLSELDVDTRIVEQQTATGFAFTREQRDATHSIMRDGSGLTLLQGLAGTAKTTSVLATVAKTAKEKGYQVRALAPTHSAAKTLADAIGAQAETVARFNLTGSNSIGKGDVIIIDEAGMVSAQDMEKMLAKARRMGAQVVITGDEHQHGSVGAGAAFAQMQQALPDRVAKLTDIKRQSSSELKQAVLDVLDGKPEAALGRVKVHEIKDREAAIAAVADSYMESVQAGKTCVATTLSNADRIDVNNAIQARRVSIGEVSNLREVDTLRSRDWTNAERGDAARWHVGDLAGFASEIEGGPRAGETARVVAVEENRVAVELRSGKRWAFDPATTGGADVYEPTRVRLGRGDEIVANANFSATGTDVDVQGPVHAGVELTVTKVGRGKIRGVTDDDRKVIINARGAAPVRKGDSFRIESRDGGQLQCRSGDGKRFTIDAREEVRLTNNTKMVVEDVRGDTLAAKLTNGQRVEINIAHGARIEHAYAQTSEKAQGRGEDHAVGWSRSTQRLADQKHLYVPMSRAKERFTLVTDDKRKLGEVVRKSVKSKEVALTDGATGTGTLDRLPAVSRQSFGERVAAVRGKVGVMLKDAKAKKWAKIEAQQERNDKKFLERGVDRVASSIDKRTTKSIRRIEKGFGIKENDSRFRRALDNKAQRQARDFIAEARGRNESAHAKVGDAYERALDRQAKRDAQRDGVPVERAREKIQTERLRRQESTALSRAVDLGMAVGDAFEKVVARHRARAEAKELGRASARERAQEAQAKVASGSGLPKPAVEKSAQVANRPQQNPTTEPAARPKPKSGIEMG